MKKILMLDDNRLFGQSVIDYFGDSYLVSLSETLAEARKLLSQTDFDAVFLDNGLPDGEGVSLIPEILKRRDNTKIILLTAFPNFNDAVKALKGGAFDYLSKPIDLEELNLTLERALQTAELERVAQFQNYQTEKIAGENFLTGDSNTFHSLQKLISKSANSKATVLITGETGTGKNMVAQAIHQQSSLKNQPFISINCAALPENLIESEIFGVEKGAFTDAKPRKGVFELADKGTLFLDEIGEMPVSLQAKLLSVLEDGKVRRLGSEIVHRFDVRIIAATNAEPEKAIEEGMFRSDLFYRLSVIRLQLVPLRERKDEIPALCRHFIRKFAPNSPVVLPDKELKKLQKYDFPGNIRELRNIVERSLILQDDDILSFGDLLPTNEPDKDMAGFFEGKIKSLEDIEKDYISLVFQKMNRNLTHTADALQISLSTLKRKVKDYGLK